MVGVKNESGGAFGMRKALALAAVLLLGACSTPQPPPPPPPVVLPPPVAHVKPKHVPLRSPTNVASAGPLKVAMVGDYMDAQEKEFRTRLRGIQVMRVGDDIIVAFHDASLFGANEGLSSRGHDDVERLAELLRRYDHSAVQVGGYMDTSLSADQSLAVSQLRAKAVADTLVSDGVPATRVSAQGFGATRLKVQTPPGTSEPRNQRIEVRVIAHPDADAAPPPAQKNARQPAPPQLRKGT